jgi:23S rRNA (uracil1939-C5)-methyltransferase
MKLRIEKQIYGGSGLARDEGKAIFVPFALAGELAKVEVAEDHGSYATAELQAILESSPHRTQPPCPYFGACGGCHYQHADYQHQLEIKLQILRESLERVHLREIPEITPLHAEPLGYRNRIRLHIDPVTRQPCYKKRASHHNLPVKECPIAAPVLENALRIIQSHAQSWQLGPTFSEIELFTNSAQDSLLLSLWTSGAPESAAQKLESLWPHLQAQLTSLRGAALFSVERGKSPSKLLSQCGDSSLPYTVSGHDYRVSVGSFFQVNCFLLDPLVELVTGAYAGALAWDLYAGVGLFSAALATRFEQIVSVESAPSAVRDLRHNLPGKQHHVIASPALDFLRRARSGNLPTPDLVIVDPPRAGLGKEVAGLLAGIRVPHITYVSCDPATLSRDLKSLLDSGYHLRAMRMVDLFPQTFHLESVAKLSLQ